MMCPINVVLLWACSQSKPEKTAILDQVICKQISMLLERQPIKREFPIRYNIFNIIREILNPDVH